MEESFPDATFDHLHPPDGNEGVYEVGFRQADEIQQSFGRSQVFLDQYSGENASQNPEIPQESASVANTVSSERMDQKNEEEADRQLVLK